MESLPVIPGEPVEAIRCALRGRRVVAPAQPPNQQWVAESGHRTFARTCDRRSRQCSTSPVNVASVLWVQMGPFAGRPEGWVLCLERLPSHPTGTLAVGVPSELMVVGAARVRARSSLREVYSDRRLSLMMVRLSPLLRAPQWSCSASMPMVIACSRRSFERVHEAQQRSPAFVYRGAYRCTSWCG